MRRALLLLCLGAIVLAEERVFLETITARESCFVHESIRLTLRIGFDRAFFETNVVQMFQTKFDVPVQVDARWPGTLVEREGLTLVLDGDATRAKQVDDRGAYTVVEIEKTFVATQPGEFVVPAPVLRYAWATVFREDFIGGRVPVDRQMATVKGAPLTLVIRPLPDPPPGFTGAVGSYTIRAEASERTLEVGETFRLILRIEGEGNRYDSPRLDRLAGFHVYGIIDDEASPLRTVTYEMAPLEAVSEVPSIPFAYFDPDMPGYRTVRTEPVPLTVRGGDTPASERKNNWIWLFLAGVVLAAVAGFVIRVRRTAPAPTPADMFRSSAGLGLADAFAEYLATKLDCATAAVIAPDLKTRLLEAGLSDDLATRTAALLERLVAARYGAEAADLEAEATALVDELEARFT